MSTPSTAGEEEIEATRDRRKRELVLGYRLFAALRWGDLGDGHITARDPERTDHFWMLAAGVAFRHATIDDLVLVGPEGDVVDGGRAGAEARINRTAYLIHWPIHEARPDVVAAAHTHTQWGTPFAAERRLLDPITQEACFFFEDHSLFDDEEVQVMSLDCGKRIAAALGPNRAVVMANHGLLTVGESVAASVAGFVTMERVCEAELKAPGAKPISAAAARAAKAGLVPEAGLRAGFDYLVASHLDG